MKYADGTKLIYLGEYGAFDCSPGEEFIIEHSKYPTAYKVKGIVDNGWKASFIENPKIFKLAEINWKRYL